MILRAAIYPALLALAFADPRTRHTQRARYADGRLMWERQYVGGREEGTHRGWWPNGARKFVYTYHDGVLEGTAFEWYADGRPFRVATYRRGHEEGPQRMWDSAGLLRASYDVREGRRYGSIGAMGCTPGDSAR